MSEPVFTVSTTNKVAPVLRKEDGGRFSLCFDLPGFRVDLWLAPEQVRALGLLCLHYFPDIEPRYAVLSEEEAYRLPARKIALLDDRSLQVLLRETQSDNLIDFLWYMKDVEIAKRVFANLSTRAGQMLFDDLQNRYGHLNPDKVPLGYAERGRAAALEIVRLLDRLQAEGLILHF